MTSFTGRYCYWVLFLRTMALLLFGCILLFFVVNAGAFLSSSLKPGEKAIRVLGLVVICYSSILLFLSILLVLVRQRFNIFFVNGDLFLQDIFTRKKHDVPFDLVKGFSTTEIVTPFLKSHCVILYLNDGRRVEFPKFLLSNFQELKTALKSAGNAYLGHESYRNDFLVKRKYKYA